MAEFWRNRRWRRFDSFVEQFEVNPRSFLTWALQNDVELYQARKKRQRGKGTAASTEPPRIETFEWTRTTEVLTRIEAGIQQLTHITNQKGARRPKRFRPKKLPSPWTAVDTVRKKLRQSQSQRFRAFQALFEYVPQEQWDAEMAEHQAAIEAGAATSPVQQRALAEAGVAPQQPPAPETR